jgi:hypothetical protein
MRKIRKFLNREFKIIKNCPRPNGRSFYLVECPFCNSQFPMQKWGMGRGKRCDCGALLYKLGLFMAKKEVVEV